MVGRDGMVRVFEDSLDDVDASFVQKILRGLDVVHTQNSVCGYPDDISFFALADASQGQTFLDAHELVFRETHASGFLEKVNVRVDFR
jgi:hypothetical protein